MTRNRLLIFAALLMFNIPFTACYYDKSEDVYPSVAAPCDTVGVRYSTDVVNILSTNCYKCHSTTSGVDGAGIKLDTWATVSTQANNGILLPVIEHVPGYSFMPKNGNQLSSCNIAVIRTWIRNGALNN